jgi:hypothetical protein
MSDALLAYDIRYSIDDGAGTFEELAEVFNVGFPNIQTEEVDVTHYQSPDRVREFIQGLADGGEIPIEINWVPGSDTDVTIRTLRSSGAVRSHRITTPNGVTWTFPGFIKGFEPSGNLGGKLAATVTVRVSGAPVYAAAVAPANTVLPSIAGAGFQVGVALLAIAGKWTNAPSLAYQWQRNTGSWVNISGATAAAYTPVEADETYPLRVTVTGTNAAGSASANSAPTAAVAAA